MRIFAVCSPGLETFLDQELKIIGILPASPNSMPIPMDQDELTGGIEFKGGFRDLYRANLTLRTASRVLVRMGEFHATSFSELCKKTEKLPWFDYLRSKTTLEIRATCRKSKLYHSDAVAERVAASISTAINRKHTMGIRLKGVEPATPQLVIVRFMHDLCTISLDSSGEHLHRRGYRLQTTKAPLRETLAAGILMASGWDKHSPLLDPFCGSGTIPIEAALLASGTPPGLRRQFSFMSWSNFNQGLWNELLASENQSGTQPIILGSDRNLGAVTAAVANAQRANITPYLQFNQSAVSSINPPPTPGWIVTNPPYGVRVKSSHDLRNLYAQMGKVFLSSCPGWNFAILCNQDYLFGHSGLKPKQVLDLMNGGIKVRLFCGAIPEE